MDGLSKKGTNMQCPHCLVHFHEIWQEIAIVGNAMTKTAWEVLRTTCPPCGKDTIYLGRDGTPRRSYSMVYPKGVARSPLPPEVPERFASDYREAALVLADSPKASAALSRRCLQNILHDHLGIKGANLAEEIQTLLDRKNLPSYIADDLDAVRNIGNFAAHPIKSTASGSIADVVPGEAEWNLNVLESAFDFYFLQPAIAAAKRANLNKKLKDAGKPEMKKQ
jgi:hypothetical protein